MEHASPSATDTATTVEVVVMQPLVLRLDDVMRVTGLRRSTLYKLMQEGVFPPPCRLSTRRVGWRSTDIEEWTASRPLTRK